MSVLTESTTTFWRGDPGYEQARRNAVANGRKPNRFPDVIVRAQTDKDVVEAVRLANTRDLKIGIRSGGHSWAASFLCAGGMLLDLSQVTDFSIDTTERTATVRPAVRGADLDPCPSQLWTVFSDRPLSASNSRRVPITGRLWMGLPLLRSSVLQCQCHRRHYGRRRTGSCRPKSKRRLVLGGARRRSGILRSGHALSSRA